VLRHFRQPHQFVRPSLLPLFSRRFEEFVRTIFPESGNNERVEFPFELLSLTGFKALPKDSRLA